jgi:hypothetical protein
MVKTTNPTEAQETQAPPNHNGATTQDSNHDSLDRSWFEFIKTAEAALNAITSLLNIGVIAVLVAWGWFHQDIIENWLWGISGGEILGVKFTREEIDAATAALQRLAESLNKSSTQEKSINVTFAEDSIRRASRVAPAIFHSRILWVDDKPDENAEIESILKKFLHIDVVPVPSTADAMRAMQVSPFDVIITNVWRPHDPENEKRELSVCRVHFFDFPYDNFGLNQSKIMNVIEPKSLKRDAGEKPASTFPHSGLELNYTDAKEVADYGKERSHELALERFNHYTNAHSAAGFGMADIILSAPGTDYTKPQIIFFTTGENAKVARPMCGYAITNRADILLNSVISILEQRHSERLVAKPWAGKDSSTP